MQSIDLNSDLGESFGPWRMGEDGKMLALVTSANIACGGHASDPETMYETLRLARDHQVIVGAHPGYNDREGFGRRIIPMTTGEISRMVAAQIGALLSIAALAGTVVHYVKLHGALANLAAANVDVARAVAETVRAVSPRLAILAISGTELDHLARDLGIETYSEIFADRGYLSSGQLVPRGREGAMIHDSAAAARRLIDFLQTGRMPVVDGDPIALEAHSICVHGDSAHAVAMAAVIKAEFTRQNITIKPFMGSLA